MEFFRPFDDTMKRPAFLSVGLEIELIEPRHGGPCALWCVDGQPAQVGYTEVA
jgi:hypothetical protein